MKLQRLYLKLLCACTSFLALSIGAHADLSDNSSGNLTKQDQFSEVTPGSNLIIHYTFDQVSDKTVPDVSGSGNEGTLINNASILSMGKYNVLNLGEGTGYLDMGQNVGNVFTELSDYTVSVYYRVDKNASLIGNGYFLWAFSVLPANNSDEGPYLAYRLNAQRFALSTGGFSNERGIELSQAATKESWQHVLYRQTGTKGELFLDGKLVGSNSNVPLPKNTFTTAPAYNWIGRAPFNGDAYLKKTLVYDFRLYNEAVAETQITEWAALTKDLDYEYEYGNTGDFAGLIASIEQYNSYLNTLNTEDYPPMALAEFKDMLTVAQRIVDDQRASQFVIDDCIATLTQSFQTFKATEGFRFEESGTPEYNPSKGFIHPGALHTQADFDRVKELLAANDPTIVAAYNKLKSNAYSQANVATYPTEIIIRGGGVGENYMNAARGASMAYQNALRWKISGDKAHAERAVQILNAWAKDCKAIGGDTNQSLASGLYGYGFANAAELVRDYEGWNPEDLRVFKEWMLYIWYPRCIDFLRRRHDTWIQGRPGHYWSNWGLCNALAVMSIGILCDDVFIYNQGVSYYKHDQVGSFTEHRTAPILNDGLTEFIGNLVPAVHADERGPYGYLGQMQESGRDQGHALMALGLAVDICQIGWNQGDDLFSFMDNRLAAGIEYVAAYNSGIEELPWTEYWYHDVRTAIHNSWKMYGNNGGGRGAFRPYWDRIIGHYEGVKGVNMSFSRIMKEKDPIDNGGGNYGQTSGGFDHLGFTTLMCTRPAVTPDQAPTTLIPTLVYEGRTYFQNELGGLSHTYETKVSNAIPSGSIIQLIPTLPEGSTDTGNWKWDTGATTKDLELTASQSGLYRVTYTNENGVESTQVYSIAVSGDCTPDQLTPSITIEGNSINDTIVSVLSGTPFTLTARNKIGWGSYRWNNGATSSSIEVSNITSDRTYTVIYTNQGGKETKLNFHIKVDFMTPSISVDGGSPIETNTLVVKHGQSVELKPMIPSGQENGIWEWSHGANTQTILLENIQKTGHYSVSYTYRDEIYQLDFHVYVPYTNKPFADGDYFIRNAQNGHYLTNDGVSISPVFSAQIDKETETQIWKISKDGQRYKIASSKDDRFFNEHGQFATIAYSATRNSFTLHGVEDGDLYAIQNSTSAGLNYWGIHPDGTVKGKGNSTLTEYPFEIIPADLVGVRRATKDEFTLYPNPMGEYLILSLDASETKSVFSIYTVEGKLVKSETCLPGKNTIQVNGLPSGIYIGVMTLNGEQTTVKIIKK